MENTSLPDCRKFQLQPAVSMGSTFQKDLFASLVSGTDGRTDTVGPVTVPFSRSGVF